MAFIRVRFNFAHYSNNTLDNKAQEIITKMTNNINFVTPIVSLADLQAVLTAYQQSLALGTRLNAEQASARRDRRAALEATLKKLALYVESVGKKDETVLASSGFDLAKRSGLVGVLSKPQSLKLMQGPANGMLKASVDKVYGARSYLFEITEVPVTTSSVWRTHPTPGRSFLFDRLEPLKEYAVRVMGVGADRTPVYSDVVIRRVVDL